MNLVGSWILNRSNGSLSEFSNPSKQSSFYFYHLYCILTALSEHLEEAAQVKTLAIYKHPSKIPHQGQ